MLENATTGSTIVTVSASNAYGDPVTYSGLSSPFSVESSTGVITLAGSLAAVSSPYLGSVQASVFGYTQTVTVRIDILQLPEVPVTCSPPHLLLLVQENLDPPFNTTQSLNCSSDSDEPFLFIPPKAIVSIDPLGYILIEENLNFENQSVFDLLVSFTNSAKAPVPGNASLSLRVLPINEYPPVFVNDSFFYTIPEDASIGSEIGELSAVDEDSGLDGEFVFSLNGGNGSDHFYLTGRGELYTMADFDYEEIVPPLFELIVTVTDTPWNASSSLTSTTSVFIEIEDVNDNPPFFSHSVYYTQVPENASILEHILTVQCNDVDSGTNAVPVYGILEQSSDDLFNINNSTGEVFLQSSLDYETESNHRITLICTDSQILHYSSQSLVVVEVLSINEYQCIFNENEIVFLVPEDTSIGTVIGHLNVSDEDKGIAGELAYQISSSSCSSVMAIDDSSSAVVLTSEFDYEETPFIFCAVSVHDKQAPFTYSSANITIEVLNVNDNPPSCQTVPPISVYGNMTTGNTLGNLLCNDVDNDNLSFVIIEDDDTLVILNHTNQSDAEIVLNRPIDNTIDNCTFVWISIAVHDGRHYAIAKVLLILYPLQERPLFTAPEYNCSIQESAMIGSLVCTVEAVCTGKAVSYTLKSETEDTFAILSNGDIVLLEQLDYEEESLHSLTVSSHCSSLNDTAIVNIIVEDVNDNSPLMPEYVFTSVNENAPYNTVVADITCTDIDTGSNGAVSLNLTSSLQLMQNGTNIKQSEADYSFYLHEENGSVSVIGDIDYETTKHYQLLVVCYDKGIPSLSSTSVLTVNVNEENEFSPLFTSPYNNSLNLTLNETNNEPGTVLHRFEASDDDSGYSGLVHYSLQVPIDVPQFLKVDSNSGELIVTSTPNCYHGQQFQYYIYATDSGKPHSLTATVSFNVLLANCISLPISNPSTYHATVNEDVSIGTIIAQFNCISPLSDDTIQYTLANNSMFHINPNNGSISTMANLDYETAVLHQLTGTCYYSQSPVLSTNLSLYVTVQPVNDNPPSFTEAAITLNVNEDMEPGSVLTVLVALDADDGPDGDLKYFINSSTKHFAIIAETGELYLTKNMDREREDHYNLLIAVTDSPVNASDARSDTMILHVAVQDTNDNRPECSRNVYKTSIDPSLAVHVPVAVIQCHDLDKGENGSLSYSIPYPSLFQINSSSGELFLSQSITEDTTSLHHTVPVLVEDHGAERKTTTVYVAVELNVSGSAVGDDSSGSLAAIEGMENLATFTIDNINKEVSV